MTLSAEKSLGVLLEWEQKLWLVYKIDSETATAFVESQDHEREILGFDTDCTVLCNPILDWPSVTLLPRIGHVIQVRKADAKSTLLVWLKDWVKIDNFQMGGALFLNPELRLGYGDRLVLDHDVYGYKTQFPVDLPRDFLSFEQKRAKETEQQETFDLYSQLRKDE